MTHTQVPAAQNAQSGKLIEQIQSAIFTNGGWMSFEQYMQMSLYSPGLGYYSGNLPKFGETGDFITAPEMGDLFGRCLAAQIQEVLGELGGGSVLEFGAGSGVLAASILNELAEYEAMPEQYFILELSGELRARQQRTLAQRAAPHLQRVKWLDALPETFDGVVIANEVLDAMPVTLFEQDQQGTVYEVGVATSEAAGTDNSFRWQQQAASPPLAEAVRALNLKLDVPVYRSEIHFQAQAWINSLATVVRRGVVLLIDYGFPQQEYYHPDRSEGTLMCHYQHRAHQDPFFMPGQQDLTAHVDFSAIARAARRAGFEVDGYTSQGSFLLATGLLNKIPLDVSAMQQIQLAQEVKKLTLPHEMGELFKVLALGRDYAPELIGFAQHNYVYKL